MEHYSNKDKSVYKYTSMRAGCEDMKNVSNKSKIKMRETLDMSKCPR